MVVNSTEKDEDIIREVAEFQGNYMPLDKDRLVLFAVDYLESKKIEPTFDKVVVTTYKFFPRKFSLIGFPEYPDGKTIYYCAYNHCTLTKKWLFGNVQSGFKVTERGKYFLEETRKMLEGKIELTRTYQVSPRRKEITFITLLKRTNAYKKYAQGENAIVNRSEILEALRIPSSSQSLIQTRLAKYVEYANRVNETSVLGFLNFAKDKLKGDNNA
jgi:hypothetical protein